MLCHMCCCLSVSIDIKGIYFLVSFKSEDETLFCGDLWVLFWLLLMFGAHFPGLSFPPSL